MTVNHTGRKIFSVKLRELSSSGEAIGTSEDGKVVFVYGGVPGELVDVVVQHETSRWIRAHLVSIRSTSSLRVVPPCVLAERMQCGGCPWMHVDREKQKEEKWNLVARALRHLQPKIHPLWTQVEDLRYRIRARMIQRQGIIGFQAARSHHVCAVDACNVVDVRLEAVMVPLARKLAPHLGDEGTLSFVMGTSNEVHVSATFGKRAHPRRGMDVLSEFVQTGKIVGARFNDTSIGRPTVCVFDGPLRVEVSADTFAQASHAGHHVLPIMVESLLKKSLSSCSQPRILELHAGSGNLTRVLLPLARTLCLVESDLTSAARLRRVLHSNLTVHATSDEIAVAAFLHAKEQFDAVVLDPPRVGARQIASKLSLLARKAIVYVSCDPMTFARDAHQIEQAGFSLVEVIPIDLMPHTPHVELVSLFLRKRDSL